MWFKAFEVLVVGVMTQTTGIDWNVYVGSSETFEERHAKDEGVFAIVSVGPVGSDEFYKLHIGLDSGQILRSNGLQMTETYISDADLERLVAVVGPAY